MTTPDQLPELGRIVIDRRVELGMRTATQLAEAMGVTTRVLGDIENGRRRVGDPTYALLEQALSWPRGTVRRVLAGLPIENTESANPLNAVSTDELVAEVRRRAEEMERAADWAERAQAAQQQPTLRRVGDVVQDVMKDVANRRQPDDVRWAARRGTPRDVQEERAREHPVGEEPQDHPEPP